MSKYEKLRRDKQVAEDLGYRAEIAGEHVLVVVLNDDLRADWRVFTNPQEDE